MLKFLILASVFWFNPLVSNIDILPDLIGYLFVLKAFSKASYVYDYAEDVCSSAKKMCIISGVKLLSITLVSSLDPTMSLLLSFGFGVVETIFGVPFFIKLFNAFSHFIPAEKGELCALAEGKIKRFTIIVFITKLVLAILPDLTALSLNSAFTLETDFTYMRFRPLFIGFSVIISLIISVVWLVKYINFVKKTVDEKVNEICNIKFSYETHNKKSVFVAKDNMRVIIVSIVGSLFLFDLTFGYTNVDVFQDFLFSGIVLLSFVYLLVKGFYKFNRYFVVLLGAFVLQIGASIFEINSNLRYYEKYNVASMLKVSEAEDMYFMLCLSAIISSVILIITVCSVLLLVKNNAKTNIVHNKELFSHSDIDYYLKDFDKRAKKNTVITIVFAIINAIIYSLMVILKPYAEWMILLNNVCEVVLIISIIGSLLYFYDEVYKKILTFS